MLMFVKFNFSKFTAAQKIAPSPYEHHHEHHTHRLH